MPRTGSGSSTAAHDGQTPRTKQKGRDGPAPAEPEAAFEIVVLGSGGGPLETDCCGYLVKARRSAWEDGVLALEGGSGLGALANLLEHRPVDTLFPDVVFPDTHATPVLRAAHIFSYLSCYLITHAHLDHVLSLILLSGSVPPRPKIVGHPQPPLIPSSTHSPSTMRKGSASSVHSAKGGSGRDRAEDKDDEKPSLPRPPVYATRATLDRLALAYGGELWPELGTWAPERLGEGKDEGGLAPRRKRRRVREDEDQMGAGGGTGVVFTPLVPSRFHRPLHPTLPITTLTYPVSHGCTSKGPYESSAFFLRYDPHALPHKPTGSSRSAIADGLSKGEGREILFFGDIETGWRHDGEGEVDQDAGERAGNLNKDVWEEAARSWREGRLAGIFIECSYESSRPAHLMFGHLSPPGLIHELKSLAQSLGDQSAGSQALDGLKVFITHIKDALIPHPTGRDVKEIIMSELKELAAKEKLGVHFVEVKKGERILV